MKIALRTRAAGLVAGLLLVLLGLPAPAHAVVVSHGYLPLRDGTDLNYTLTLPSATGRYPVLLEYGPYAEGVTSDAGWASGGYAFLGVNMRGTGCSQGTFQPLRSDIWGRDGASVVDWASRQPWADGRVAMWGVSFTGTSQIATAEYAGPALKAILPFDPFPDMYRSLVHPGGIYNSWIAGWVGAGRQFVVGAASFEATPNDAHCAQDEAGQAAPNEAQSADTAAHPFLDAYWATQPQTLARRVRVPVLGCVNWQDTTVHSYAFDDFRRLEPDSTWLVGGDGAHSDCPASHNLQLRFLDHFVKGEATGWDDVPHLLLAHEVPPTTTGAENVPDDAPSWTTGFSTWNDLDHGLHAVSLYLRAGGALSLSAPTTAETPDSYLYGAPTDNTPHDFAGQSFWNDPAAPGGELTYTTPRLAHDAEFLGSGSANLWIAADAPDSDVQITLSEIRPDGQEEYVQNGWLRLSRRKLDRALSTPLRPIPTDLAQDVQPLDPTIPVRARIQLLPLDHVFRAGSAIRLTIDTPGGYYAIFPAGGQDTVEHSAAMPSALVLGLVPGAAAHAPLPACTNLLNQPCRTATGPIPPGTLDVGPR